jgi:transposase
MQNEEVRKFEELKASLRRGDARLLVGIDVAKDAHVARVEHSDGTVLLEKVGIANTREGFESFRNRLEELRKTTGLEVVCAMEPSGGYQKLIGNYLEQQCGYRVVQVSGVVANRNRRTMGGSWLKTDSRDAENLVDLLRQGKIIRYESSCGALEEARRLLKCERMMAQESSRVKVRMRNRLLSVSFPELEEIYSDMNTPDLLTILRTCPSAKEITRISEEDFLGRFPRITWGGWRVRRLKQVYEKARESIGVEVGEGFRWECRWAADRLGAISAERKELQKRISRTLSSDPCYQMVQTIPGIGKLLGAIFVVEIGDCANYRHWRQVIKLAGLDLAVVESGKIVGKPRITKQGKSMLRWAAYQAAVVACSKNQLFMELYRKALGNRMGVSGAKKRTLVKMSVKLLRIAFAVMRDQRAYAPERVIPA